jgi:hypothetical protein
VIIRARNLGNGMMAERMRGKASMMAIFGCYAGGKIR